MSSKIRVDFFKDHQFSDQVEAEVIFDSIKAAQKNLINTSVKDIIGILSTFGSNLLKRDNPLHRKYPGQGVPYIASWCTEKNLTQLLNHAFQDLNHIDHFLAQPHSDYREYRALPKGLVVHWMAGNVPTLGFLSLIQGILTKNSNLIKAPSASNELLSELLTQISNTTVEGSSITGKELMDTVAVIRYERSQKALAEKISKEADVRLFWGSDESVSVLKSLKSKMSVTDLTFSNKVSIMMVDEDCLKNETENIVRKIALDMSVFEQKACASPHTIFIETEDQEQINRFAIALKDALQKILRTLPKEVPTQQETSAILNLRAKYDMFHEAWYSDGLEFSILNDNEKKVGPAIGNRTIFLRGVNNLVEVSEYLPDNIQSVGIKSSGEKFDQVTMALANAGVQRFSEIGSMTQFEMPWDGYIISQKLVRWVSRPNY